MNQIVAACGSIVLVGCVAPTYEGDSITRDSQGNLVCGIHGTPVEEHTGYRFSGGLIHGTEEDEFAQRRYPNTLDVGFSPEYEDDENWPYTWPGKAYTCEKCYEGHNQLRKLPMWYKRAFER